MSYADKIGSHWDRTSLNPNPMRTRWWQSQLVVAHINALVCGEECYGLSEGLRRLVKRNLGPALPLRKGVAIGGGNGLKEMSLIRAGIVEQMTIFELSSARIEQGIAKAAEIGLSEQIQFLKEDAFANQPEDVYDLIHWNNSLHHMLDVEHAIKWSIQALRVGGLFLLDDYVGLRQLQASPQALEMASAVRELLPKRWLKDPKNPTQLLSRRCANIDPQALKRDDPSEAADSERILQVLKRELHRVEIVLTGGVVYSIALNDVFANIDEDNPMDRALLKSLMIIDKQCITCPEIESPYAIAFAIK